MLQVTPEGNQVSSHREWLGSIQKKTWKMINIYDVWQEQAGKVGFFHIIAEPTEK